ncbi:hypothetical protein AOZ07_02815 [Glutamicibacter halophytocola]|uniref:hypothetical protein n=1 Tax=Glutamicibacter halophytocola TaxID=1933880 RepID=UPI0006D49DCA|nr:hypothetical protein [Glutamicibacter halophytocola]ALG28032.1 hypothetical protein AOZ07_02815 [Glutamicibacter halophytocola]
MAITATGYRNRLLEEAPALGIQVSKKQAEKIGIRIARRIESQMVELDFYEALRIMGIISDPTARDAVRNLEAAA